MGQLVFQAALGGAVNLIGPNISATTNFTLPGADGTNGQALTTNGSGTLGFSSIVSGAAGSNTQVQFNSGGNFGASSSLTWSGTILTSTGFAGPINGTIGATTANTGNFTTLTTSSTVTLNGGTANGVTYLNGSKVLTSGTALTFDGSTFVSSRATDGLLTRFAGASYGLTINSDVGAGIRIEATDPTGAASWQPMILNATNQIFKISNSEKMRISGATGGVGAVGIGYSSLTSVGDNGLAVLGNVGIGTSSPTQKLQVAGNVAIADGGWFGFGDVNERIVGNNAGYLQFYTDGTEAMRLLSGNLGLGTSAPKVPLQINSFGGLDGNGNQFYITNNQYYDSVDARDESIKAGYSNRIVLDNNAGGILFQTTSTSAAGANTAVTLTERVRISSDGTFRVKGAGTAGSTDAVQFSGSAPASAMALDSSGNLGLGVTPSAWGNGYKSIDLNTFGGWTSTTSAMDLVANGYYNGTNWIAKTTAASSRYVQTSGAHTWKTAASVTAGNSLSYSDLMTLDASGNLGVGTTSPTSRLHVVGSKAIFQMAGPSQGSIQFGTTDTTHYIGAGNDYLGMEINSTGTGNEGIKFLTGTSGSGTERARFNTTGALVFAGGTTTADGIGITFPATQSASTNANTLDDYEEGTFTPTVIGSTTAGTATYSTQNARYTKIGRLVQFEIYLVWTGGTGTGGLLISGLPFVSSNSSTYPAVSLSLPNNLALTALNVAVAFVENNNTTINIYQYPTGGGASTGVTYDAAASIMLSGTYSI